MPAFVLGIGGSGRPGSVTEKALRVSLAAAAAEGAETLMLGAPELLLPLYVPEARHRAPEAVRLVEEVRRSEGLIIASPGYHGSVSGLVKNALDYLEDLREEDPPYLDGRAVGCIAVASGWQAAVSTLGSLRSVVHALRGWPTPMGAAINARAPVFDHQGRCVDPSARLQLELVGRQVVQFARMRSAQAVGR
jgi:FMN reductase